MKRKLEYFIFAVFILGGFFFRFYNLRFNTSFNWDQEHSVAYPAREIIFHHHYPLIGAKTQIGDIYLGPLYSYLAALFFFVFKMDPITGAISAATLSLITLISGFFLFKSIFNYSIALYSTSILATSTFVVFLDRIPWNVNLFSLASVLTASGLWLVLKGTPILGGILAGIGLFLGVNSHFTVSFLFLIVIFFLFLNRKAYGYSVFWSLFFLIIGLSPLFFFELRHQFLISRNFIRFFNYSIISFSGLLPQIIKSGRLILETTGKLFFFEEERWIQETFGLFFFLTLFLFRKQREIRFFLQVFILYFVIYFLGFAFYSKGISDYYYTGLLPLTAIGFALLFVKIEEKFFGVQIFFIFLLFLNLGRSFLLVQKMDPQSLGFKQILVKKIKEVNGNKFFSVVYDMELGHSYGYDYLFDYYQLKTKKVSKEEAENIFWISYPQERFPGIPDYIFGDLALGLPENTKKIFTTKNVEMYGNLFRIRIPKNWEVLQCPDFDFDKYLLSPDHNVSCNTYSQEKVGLAILNLPDCSLWEVKEKKELSFGGNFPFFLVSTRLFKHLSSQINRDYVLATSLEEGRCLFFLDLGNSNPFSLSAEVKGILESAKK